jgi:N-acetylmuramoyl-L-alanine amidase
MKKIDKIYLIAGHGGSDRGARSAIQGVNEADLTLMYQELLYTKMMYIMNEFKHKPKVVKDNEALSLSSVIAWIRQSTKSENALVIDIHFNAFNKIATGTEVYVRERKPNTPLDNLARAMVNLSTDIMRIANRGVRVPSASKRGTLGIFSSASHVILKEVCFIDNINDYNAFMNNLTELVTKEAHLILSSVQNDF